MRILAFSQPRVITLYNIELFPSSGVENPEPGRWIHYVPLGLSDPSVLVVWSRDREQLTVWEKNKLLRTLESFLFCHSQID